MRSNTAVQPSESFSSGSYQNIHHQTHFRGRKMSLHVVEESIYDTKYYDTKYYSGLLYTRKQNFSKESIFSLLPPSRGRPAWSSIFSGGHRMPGHLPQSDKGNSAPPGSDHIWYSIYTHQALPLRTWIQCWERGPKGKAVGQMCSSQLQITPRRTSSFLCT